MTIARLHTPATRSLAASLVQRPETAGILLLVLLLAFFQIQSGGAFLSADNLRGLAALTPEIAIVVVGVTVLMIAGEFDLSVGSVFALAPMCMALLLEAGMPMAVALALGLLAAAMVGLANGVITLKSGIPSFIVTLGMLYMARSVTVVLSGGFPPVLPSDLPDWLFVAPLWSGSILRMSFVWFLALALAAGWMMGRSNLGNWIAATGGSREAAAAMGVPVANVKLFAFVLCSLLAGIAGILQVLRLGTPYPSIGEGVELQAISAAVIGGAALSGGIGTVLGGVVGAVLVRAIDNGMVLTRIDANWFKFAIGFLTVFAVIANGWLRSKTRGLKLGGRL
ncbi:ABC transporter permease [Tropicimonas sp.]|uniref:ABC transporter permease n=1 Tax=Tropicimonas sp. TaxID=2067044 RepID=UPI003A89DF98